MFNYHSDEWLTQCLLDAGCNKQKISGFLACRETQNKEEELSLLKQHRLSLLDQIHSSQSQLDCLDDWISELEQTLTQNMNKKMGEQK